MPRVWSVARVGSLLQWPFPPEAERALGPSNAHGLEKLWLSDELLLLLLSSELPMSLALALTVALPDESSTASAELEFVCIQIRTSVFCVLHVRCYDANLLNSKANSCVVDRRALTFEAVVIGNDRLLDCRCPIAAV